MSTEKGTTVYEMGVWSKIWRGEKKVRGDQDAKLQNLAQRRGDTIGSWTYKYGWVEEWTVQGSGDLIRYKHVSPTPHGFKLVALGVREVAELGEGNRACKEVVEAWKHVGGEVSTEDVLNKTGIIEGQFQWLYKCD